MIHADLETLAQRAQLGTGRLARLLGRHRRTVEGWRQGRVMSRAAVVQVRRLLALSNDELAAVTAALTKPNRGD